MKQYYLIIIVLFGITSYAQKIESYEIGFESKLGTKATIDLLLTYSDSSDIPEKEIALNKIKQPTAELLKKYTTTEIYYSKKNEIDSILQKRVINEFKDSKYNVKTSIIGYVNLPKETKILYDK